MSLAASSKPVWRLGSPEIATKRSICTQYKILSYNIGNYFLLIDFLFKNLLIIVNIVVSPIIHKFTKVEKELYINLIMNAITVAASNENGKYLNTRYF